MSNLSPGSRKGLLLTSGFYWTLTVRYFCAVQEDQLLEIVKRKKARATSIGIAPEAQESDSDDAPSSSPEFELRRNGFKSSTKLNALMQHLRSSTWPSACSSN